MNDLYIHECVLPSHKATLYPDNPELTGTFKLGMIGVEDEAEYLGSHNEETINSLLKTCVIEPANFDPSVLVEEDRYALLMQMRIHSYGDLYHVHTRCPECSHEEDDKSISLDDIPIVELDENFKEPIEVTLPVIGKTVGVRWLRAKELRKIATDARMKSKAQKKKPSVIEYFDRVVKQIVTIDGEDAKRPDIVKLVRQMPGRDRARIDHVLEKYQFGSTNMVEVTCDGCGHIYDTPVVITSEFFRPRFDD